MLKTCVIGMGPIGNIHSTMYKEDELANFVAVCDWNKERADARAGSMGDEGKASRAMIGMRGGAFGKGRKRTPPMCRKASMSQTTGRIDNKCPA